ncbi:pancreatic triacylglycerol lipase-like [Clavelina lepadiformis]|uniref:pancreatic triacylglycerol lipase-like n=1 Tax=Clavelina lepadiformis TaxID=159417 RepID=UPI0040410FB3
MKIAAFCLLFAIWALQCSASDTVCYGDLGCFTDAPPWGGTDERPIAHVPQSPEEINVKFFLDTRAEKDVQVSNDDMTALRRTDFDYRRDTKFIIHGFLDNGGIQWLEDMSDAFLAVEDLNVIRVSWPGGSFTVQYAQSSADTQVVGAEVGLFINNIVKEFGGDTKSFHCIGHSLGAQTCGYLGAGVPGKVGRITGLDPAGPYFEGTPNEVRLDSSDADFVDVIHTDAEKLKDFGFGINQVSGIVDFWPNDGIQQPGCDQNAISTIVGIEGIADGTRNFVACNHMRAIHFFIESIGTNCPFTGNECTSYGDYRAGKCLTCPSGKCTSMGYGSIKNKNVILQSDQGHNFLQTAPFSPYCEYMTYVQVTLGSNSDGVSGKLYLTLYGSSSNTEQVQLSDEDVSLELRPSTTFSYVAQYSLFPNGFNKVKLLWEQDEFTVTNQQLTVFCITVWVDFEQKLYSFCGDASQKLNEKTRYSYYTCSQCS